MGGAAGLAPFSALQVTWAVFIWVPSRTVSQEVSRLPDSSLLSHGKILSGNKGIYKSGFSEQKPS